MQYNHIIYQIFLYSMEFCRNSDIIAHDVFELIWAGFLAHFDHLSKAVNTQTKIWCSQLLGNLCEQSNNADISQTSKCMEQCPEIQKKLNQQFKIKITNFASIEKQDRLRSKTLNVIKNQKQKQKQIRIPSSLTLAPMTQFNKKIRTTKQIEQKQQRNKNRSVKINLTDNKHHYLNLQRKQRSITIADYYNQYDQPDKLSVITKKYLIQSKKSLYPEQNKSNKNILHLNLNTVNVHYNVTPQKLIKNRNATSESMPNLAIKYHKLISIPKKDKNKSETVNLLNINSNANKCAKQQPKQNNRNTNQTLGIKYQSRIREPNPKKLTLKKNKDYIHLINKKRLRQYFPSIAKLYDQIHHHQKKP